MIPRYSRPEMVKIWSEDNKYKIWYMIEAHACSAQEILGVIPSGTAERVWRAKDLKFNSEKIAEIESVTKHDVIAFLTHLAEFVGEDAKFIHQGMTSSDVLDTCFNIQLKQSCELLLSEMDKLLQSLKSLAFKHKKTICIGRSHGIHAEPTTFGIKMAQAYAEMKRNRGRLVDAQKEISYGAISGAVGTFSTIDPYVEKYVCEKMGLIPEPVSSQVIPRDRHAFYFSILAIIASSIERLSVEIRHLQRSEVLEAEEFFSQGQKGSSAMPHKRNPVLSENLTGLSRLVRMNVIPSLENICLWHERDISHSSVERNIGPDANILLDFSLNRLSGLISNLVVYPENMRANLNKLSGLVNSQRVLLALIQEGESREKAYEIVQRCAMTVWDTKEEFFEILANDKEVSLYLSRKQLEGCFDENFHLKNVDIIFDRVFV